MSRVRSMERSVRGKVCIHGDCFIDKGTLQGWHNKHRNATHARKKENF